MRDFHEGSSLMRSPGIRVPALLQERLQPRAFAPSPAKAGEGWGGVPFGSFRTVGTPSQPPPAFAGGGAKSKARRSEEHTSELQSLMRISYAVFCLKKKKHSNTKKND